MKRGLLNYPCIYICQVCEASRGGCSGGTGECVGGGAYGLSSISKPTEVLHFPQWR